MTKEQIIKLQLKTFEESLDYYLIKNSEDKIISFVRNKADNVNQCLYKATNEVTNKGCLVGRLLEPETRKSLDNEYKSGISITRLDEFIKAINYVDNSYYLDTNGINGTDLQYMLDNPQIFENLKQVISKYGIEFLSKLQSFHDNTNFLTEKVIITFYEKQLPIGECIKNFKTDIKSGRYAQL